MAVKQITYENNSYAINYEILNPECEKTIVFLHGWGSNKEVMKSSFSPFLKDFKHIYLDMPGFGKTQTTFALTTSKYAAIVTEFLKNEKNIIAIAGHSFGGKVATLMEPKNLILLSTAGIIEEKSSQVKYKIKLAKFLNSFGLGKLGKMFRSKDVNTMSENMYETFKNVVDENFEDVFKNYKNNTLIFWGELDNATSLESGKKISNLMENSKFYSYNDDHYFFMKNANDITTKIEDGIL